jgi:nitronate monooxygenase
MIPTLARLGIDLPIIQAPMAGVQDSALAIAVSNVGGLGSLPGAMLDKVALRAELEAIRAGTSQPYNVNFFCHTAPAPDPVSEQAWRECLAPYYREFGIDADAIPTTGARRRPFDHAVADVIEPFCPPIVSFHFGLPSSDLVARVKAWGAFVLSSATTVAEARWLEARGADAVIAQGLEAGGHRGHFLSQDVTLQFGTFALVPRIVDAVRIPVIAAGGIADRRGVAAAFALGASAVQVGSAYLLCPEATTSPLHRAALMSEAASHTALTNLFSGGLARGIVNRLMREIGPVNALAPPFPLGGAAVAALRSAAERAGKGDFSPLWAGQSAFESRQMGAAVLTRDLMT